MACIMVYLMYHDAKAWLALFFMLGNFHSLYMCDFVWVPTGAKVLLKISYNMKQFKYCVNIVPEIYVDFFVKFGTL